MQPFFLTETETRLAKAIEEGETFRGDDRSPPSIRAEALRRMLLSLPVWDICASEGRSIRSHPSGLRLQGAKITGPLTVDDAITDDGGLLPPLVLENCLIPDDISLCRAQFEYISLRGSRLKHLCAAGIRVASLLDLSSLSSAEVDGTTTGIEGRGSAG